MVAAACERLHHDDCPTPQSTPRRQRAISESKSVHRCRSHRRLQPRQHRRRQGAGARPSHPPGADRQKCVRHLSPGLHVRPGTVARQKAAAAAGTTAASDWALPLAEYNTLAGAFSKSLRNFWRLRRDAAGDAPGAIPHAHRRLDVGHHRRDGPASIGQADQPTDVVRHADRRAQGGGDPGRHRRAGKIFRHRGRQSVRHRADRTRWRWRPTRRSSSR